MRVAFEFPCCLQEAVRVASGGPSPNGEGENLTLPQGGRGRLLEPHVVHISPDSSMRVQHAKRSALARFRSDAKRLRGIQPRRSTRPIALGSRPARVRLAHCCARNPICGHTAMPALSECSTSTATIAEAKNGRCGKQPRAVFPLGPSVDSIYRRLAKRLEGMGARCVHRDFSRQGRRAQSPAKVL